MDCEVRKGNDCYRQQNLWLKCSLGDDEEEEEEKEEEEQGLDLEFGGAKLTLSLNKIRQKWRF